jgi:hypothetical protein
VAEARFGAVLELGARETPGTRHGERPWVGPVAANVRFSGVDGTTVVPAHHPGAQQGCPWRSGARLV